jgi:hypothetical protein
MKNIKLSKRTYLVAFAFVMLLNALIAAFLFRTVLAQTSDSKLKNQTPITVEVVKQTNNPLLITIVNVDNSNQNYQMINYSVQNISNKSIRGYVTEARSENSGKISTDFFPAKLFQTGITYNEELIVERENIKLNKNLSLLIDYVEFEDGSYWGEDTQGQSEQIAGGLVGAKMAIEYFESFIENRELLNLRTLMDKPLKDIEITLPEISKSKNEKWQDGFRNGYKSIIGFVKNQKGKSDEQILSKLNEIKENIQPERRQKK